MNLPARFDQDPSRFHHIAFRLVLIVCTLLFLPSIFFGDINHYWKSAQGISFSHLPYRDFLWEFPPFTTPLLALVPISFGSKLLFDILITSVMIALEVATLRIVRAMVQPERRARVSWYWLFVIIPLCSITYFRLDWPAAFFGAIAISGLVNDRVRPTVVGILGGFGVKMWTIVAAVPLFAMRRYKALILSLATSALMLGAWYAFSPEGVAAFTNFRKGSAFQVESIPGSLMLLFTDRPVYFEYGAWMVSDSGWSWVQPLMPAFFCLCAAVSGIVLWFKKSFDAVALFGALVLLLLLTSRIISPQYMIWLAPFTIVLFARNTRQMIFFAVAVYLTLAEIEFYSPVLQSHTWAVLLVVVRNAALLAMLVEWTRLILRAPDAQSQAATAEVGSAGIVNSVYAKE